MKLLVSTLGLAITLVSLSAFNNTLQKTTAKRPHQNATAVVMSRGKVVYTTYCMPCHQIDGSGVPNMNPPLIKTSYVLGDKTTLVKIVTKGWNKGVEIDGDEYTNPMPAQTNLTDQQVADVLTFVRNSFGNKATALTLSEVKVIKAKLK